MVHLGIECLEQITQSCKCPGRRHESSDGVHAELMLHGSPPSWSDVHKVKLSRKSCIIRVESLYESSATLSSSAIASSKAVRAILQASSGFDKTSYWKTE